MSVTIDVRFNHFPQMASRITPATRDITQKAIFDMVAIADPLTPVDTGHLKNAKTVGPESIHWHADYAAHQNFGTVHVPPTLFATTAVERVKPQWIRALSQLEGRL